jgi:hypothetical protein
MFTLQNQSSRLAIRLPEDKRAEFLKKYKTALFEAYGTVMQEYVAVPDALLKNTKELKKYLEFSYEYVLPVQWPGVYTKGLHECDPVNSWEPSSRRSVLFDVVPVSFYSRRCETVSEELPNVTKVKL